MSETLESYCEYYKRPCTVSDGLCSECGERLIEPASGATEESPKTKGMTNGKQRVEEILQKYSNAVVDEAVEKCVGGGIVVFAERAKAKRLEALDSIEEVMADERKDERRTVANEIGEVHEVQGSHGNWNYDPYMHGMYNGMELCSAIVKGVEPKFKKAPKKWIAEIRGADTKEDKNVVT